MAPHFSYLIRPVTEPLWQWTRHAMITATRTVATPSVSPPRQNSRKLNWHNLLRQRLGFEYFVNKVNFDTIATGVVAKHLRNLEVSDVFRFIVDR